MTTLASVPSASSKIAQRSQRPPPGPAPHLRGHRWKVPAMRWAKRCSTSADALARCALSTQPASTPSC
eukprot:11073035-Alexandrium_andersonii.AAC.1